MRWITCLLLAVVLGGWILQAQRIAFHPSEGLMFNVLNHENIWEPLRRARIHLYIARGATPDDKPYGGRSILEAAVRQHDSYFVANHAGRATPETLIESLHSVCESPDDASASTIRDALIQRDISVPPCEPSSGSLTDAVE